MPTIGCGGSTTWRFLQPHLLRLTWNQPTSAFSLPGVECRISLLEVVSFGQPCPSVGFAPDDDSVLALPTHLSFAILHIHIHSNMRIVFKKMLHSFQSTLVDSANLIMSLFVPFTSKYPKTSLFEANLLHWSIDDCDTVMATNILQGYETLDAVPYMTSVCHILQRQFLV